MYSSATAGVFSLLLFLYCSRVSFSQLLAAMSRASDSSLLRRLFFLFSFEYLSHKRP